MKYSADLLWPLYYHVKLIPEYSTRLLAALRLAFFWQSDYPPDALAVLLFEHTAGSRLINRGPVLCLKTWDAQRRLIISNAVAQVDWCTVGTRSAPSGCGRGMFLIKDDAPNCVWIPNAIVRSKLSVSLRRRLERERGDESPELCHYLKVFYFRSDTLFQLQ